MRPLLFAALLPCVAAAQYPGSQPVPTEVKAGWNAITEADAKTWLNFLAGPETQGRGTGQPGFQKAADFMAARFKAMGLKPVGDNGTYFQNVPFHRTKIVPGSVRIAVDGTKFATDGIETSTVGKKLDGAGGITIVRTSGGSLPQNFNVQNRLVLIVGDLSSWDTYQLANQEPVALLKVREAAVPYNWRVSRDEFPDVRRIYGTISESAAKRLLQTIKADPGLLKPPATPNKTGLTPFSNKVTFTAKVDAQNVNVPNVVGLLPGADKVRSSEIVGIGAHLDHLGQVGPTIYPGADDDGSGSTSLLLVAKALTKSTVRHKRSILFMAFCGEEMGLLGSSYYADHPIFPHAKMVAELQMDMVGRDSEGIQNGDPNRVDVKEENFDTIRLVGSKRISTELDAIIQRLNAYTNFKFKYDAEDVYERSDHYNLAKNGIPISFFFDGFHPDYHQPTDTVDKINFLKLTTTARLVYLTATELATMPKPPVKDGQ